MGRLHALQTLFLNIWDPQGHVCSPCKEDLGDLSFGNGLAISHKVGYVAPPYLRYFATWTAHDLECGSRDYPANLLTRGSLLLYVALVSQPSIP